MTFLLRKFAANIFSNRMKKVLTLAFALLVMMGLSSCTKEKNDLSFAKGLKHNDAIVDGLTFDVYPSSVKYVPGGEFEAEIGSNNDSDITCIFQISGSVVNAGPIDLVNPEKYQDLRIRLTFTDQRGRIKNKEFIFYWFSEPAIWSYYYIDNFVHVGGGIESGTLEVTMDEKNHTYAIKMAIVAVDGSKIGLSADGNEYDIVTEI